MRPFLIQFLLALSIVSIGKSQVVGLEYFLGDDPGIGKATSLSVNAGNTVADTYILPLSELAVGFHMVGVRAKDAQGRFSQTFLHSFYLQATNSTDITAVEYFIDIDPGHGNGKSIPIQVDEQGNIKYIVPLSDTAEGSHLLGIRTRNGTGNWSQTKSWFFYNYPGGIPRRIVRLSYTFAGEGAPNKVYSYMLPELAANVDISTFADLSDLESGKQYTIHLTAIDETGQVSNRVSATFSTIPPIVIERIDTSHLTCFESNNGSATITAAGGEGSLEYSLDGEQYSANSVFENLSAGDYKVFVRGTENVDYVVEGTFTINSPAQLTIAVTDVLSPSCPGDSNGGFKATATGGTGPYRYKLQSQAEFQNADSFADLQAGTYTVTVVDANGCELSVEVQLIPTGVAPAIPTITVQGTDGISTEVFLQSSSPTGNQWLRNGTEIPGATGQTLEITQAGSYHVKVAGSTGCFSVSTSTVITAHPEIRLQKIRIYPNPAEDRAKIDFGREVFINRITIVSSSGMVLKTQTENRETEEIWLDLSGLPNGTYIIQIEAIGHTERLKLLKR